MCLAEEDRFGRLDGCMRELFGGLDDFVSDSLPKEVRDVFFPTMNATNASMAMMEFSHMTNESFINAFRKYLGNLTWCADHPKEMAKCKPRIHQMHDHFGNEINETV